MARARIDYGIDLGTTNSAICRIENGVPVIKKIEVTDEIMPSCVYVDRKKRQLVGKRAYTAMKRDKRNATKTWKVSSNNSYVEFKRYMGTDTVFHNDILDHDFTPVELSAEVLKALKSYIPDETVKSAVITVPAKFTVNQKTATLEAAKVAGLEYSELLQEPVAAAYAYGMASSKTEGYWLVFDFGGGTFDAALLTNDEGIITVKDTEGDNHLGGKDLDLAISVKILIPYLWENFSIDRIMSNGETKQILIDAMKTYSEEAKNALSFNDSFDLLTDLGDLGEDDDGEELALDMTITREKAYEVMRPIFQRAVDICKRLLERNHVDRDALTKLILVGGPTHSPLIKEMLKEQITDHIDSSIDPMTAVAIGASLYASTIDAKVDGSDVKMGTIRLNLSYEATSVNDQEYVTIQLDKATTGTWCPDSINIELIRTGSGIAWSSGTEAVDANGNVFTVDLRQGHVNEFQIKATDNVGNVLGVFPNSISIIQGSKVGNAVLPYFFGFAFWGITNQKQDMGWFEGLEKNRTLPAVGVNSQVKTSCDIRPGVKSDILRIPIYQADERNSQGSTNPYFYEYVADVIVDGTDVNAFIPEGSSVELTLKVDLSEQMTLDVFFPTQDVTVSKHLDTSQKKSVEEAANRVKTDLRTAQTEIGKLSANGIDTSDLQAQLQAVKDEDDNSQEKKSVLDHLKEVLRNIDKKQNETAFDRLEKRLRKAYKELEEDQQKYGDIETGKLVQQIRSEMNEVISKKDEESGKVLLDKIDYLDFKLALIEYYISWIYNWNRTFDSKTWKDNGRARQLINQGMDIISNSPTTQKLKPIIEQLFELLPDAELPADAHGLLQG